MKGIYKITNPEGKIYIGKSKDIEKRFSNYKQLNCKQQPLIFVSLAKYGWLNHKFEIIEECSTKLLTERENFFIEKFNTTNNGLNVKGQGNWSYKKEYPEHARIRKSITMKKKWKDGYFHRKWAKQVKNAETGEVYNTMKECAEKNKISHTKLLKNIGPHKKFFYLNNHKLN
jgi:group I intron endonuclease